MMYQMKPFIELSENKEFWTQFHAKLALLKYIEREHAKSVAFLPLFYKNLLTTLGVSYQNDLVWNQWPSSQVMASIKEPVGLELFWHPWGQFKIQIQTPFPLSGKSFEFWPKKLGFEKKAVGHYYLNSIEGRLRLDECYYDIILKLPIEFGHPDSVSLRQGAYLYTACFKDAQRISWEAFEGQEPWLNDQQVYQELFDSKGQLLRQYCVPQLHGIDLVSMAHEDQIENKSQVSFENWLKEKINRCYPHVKVFDQGNLQRIERMPKEWTEHLLGSGVEAYDEKIKEQKSLLMTFLQMNASVQG